MSSYKQPSEQLSTSILQTKKRFGGEISPENFTEILQAYRDSQENWPVHFCFRARVLQ
jgi:hypothetical protein